MILVVDDERPIVKLCQAMLGTLGYSVKTAASGSEAVTAVKNATAPIRLVLLDMNLPDMSLEEIVRGIRHVDERIRILVQSGQLMQKDDFCIMGLGVCDCLQKPYSIKELSEKLARALPQ